LILDFLREVWHGSDSLGAAEARFDHGVLEVRIPKPLASDNEPERANFRRPRAGPPRSATRLEVVSHYRSLGAMRQSPTLFATRKANTTTWAPCNEFG
jgi:hypothetical protein